MRDLPPHQAQPDEDWGDIAEVVSDLVYTVRENQRQMEDISESLEGVKRQSKNVLMKLDDIQHRINCKLSDRPQSPRDQATIDLFTD